MAAYICKFTLCQQEVLLDGIDRGFPGNAKVELCSQNLLYQTLHARLNENDIHNFLKTVSFLQKYSDIKTTAPGFDFETCTAQPSVLPTPLTIQISIGGIYFNDILMGRFVISQTLENNAVVQTNILPVALLSSVACEIAPLRIVLFMCFCFTYFYFFTSLFIRVSSTMIMYDRRTLLDIGQRYTNLIQDTLSTDPAWPLEILRNNELNNDHLNNRRRRRKHRGRRAGIRNRLRDRAHSPPLPSILLANVQSLENKMDDLRARISFQRDIRDCNILCLTETWLTPTVPDTAVTPSDNFSILRMDRTAEAGKTKGGGVCFMINKKWCDPRNIPILSCSCSPHLEHLSIICHPFYLPREFSSIVISSVYIPPQADTSLALLNLHDVLSGYNNKHPDAAFIIAGDFNKANLKKVLPNFHQHISCPTRGLNTLDHCYTPLKYAYKAHSLPSFGKSDHVAIFLTPEYKQRIVHEPPVEREVTRWSSHSEAMLQASLDDVDWDMFRASSSDVSEFTDVALSFVNTLTEQATETVTIRTFSNQKPWVDRSYNSFLSVVRKHERVQSIVLRSPSGSKSW